MNKKELKGLAKKIAFQEFRRATATIPSEKQEAEQLIIKLSSRIKSIHDMMLIDDMILEELDRLEKDKNS